MSPENSAWWGSQQPERIERRIVIERDGMVVARSGKVEYGQGIRTGFAKIVAEELGVPLDRVRVELGETERVPWDMGTFGSLSTATDGTILRSAACYARTLLLERASIRFKVPSAALDTLNGRVFTRDGRAVTYQELTAARPLTGVIPGNETGFRKPVPADSAPYRLEGLDIVTGRACYPADVRLPDMVRGHVLHPPLRDCRLIAVDDRAARSLPGVVEIVRDGDFVGVVAERDEQALAGVRALKVEWRIGEGVPAKPVDIVIRRDSGLEAAFSGSPRILRARYHLPHIAHASIGPGAAVANVREESADLYVATQRPFGLREEVAGLLGFPPECVRVHPQTMGGMYGRGNMNDVPLEAVRLSRAAGRPVLVQWTREEEFRLSPHRPILDAEIHAAMNHSGAVAGWRYQVRTNPHAYGENVESRRLIEMTAGRNAVPPYRLENSEILLQVVPGEIRTGAFRSLAAAPNVFAIESFIDELSDALAMDSIVFRLNLIEDRRLRRVLETVRERSRWDRRPSEPGHGFGAACAIYNGTRIAQVAEILMTSSGGVRLEHIWCAVDAGRLVHPDGARNQIEGGIQQAASWTLLEELHHQNGEVMTSTWHDYPIATFRDAPREIDVVFLADHNTPSTGVGEPGSVPTAAAIANAVFQACGARVRELPLGPKAIAASRK